MDITGHTEVCWPAFHVLFVVYLSTWPPLRAQASCACCVVRVLLHPTLIWSVGDSVQGLNEGPSLGYWGPEALSK